MLALVVISVGLMALVQSVQTGVRVADEFAQKSNAYHVADQVMMQLYQSVDLRPGKHQGQETMAGQVYYWSADMQSTDNRHINRIDLVVGVDRKLDYVDAQLTGFKKR